MPPARIHSTAVVHPDAHLEENVEVGPFAVLGPQVKVGRGTVIGSHSVLEYAEIGPDCQIFPHAFVGTPPQDMGYKGQPSGVMVGAGTVIRECVTVHRSKHEGGVTRIGERCMLMAYSHVAHDCILGQGVIMANYTGLAGHVEIGDSAFLSGHIGVHQFVRIGKLVMISAGSMIGQDIAPFCTAQGDRSSLFGLNLIGLRRAGLKAADIAALKSAYKTIFSLGLNLQEALEKLAGDPNPYVQHFTAFIQGSKRGLCRPLRTPAQESPLETGERA